MGLPRPSINLDPLHPVPAYTFAVGGEFKLEVGASSRDTRLSLLFDFRPTVPGCHGRPRSDREEADAPPVVAIVVVAVALLALVMLAAVWRGQLLSRLGFKHRGRSAAAYAMVANDTDNAFSVN